MVVLLAFAHDVKMCCFKINDFKGPFQRCWDCSFTNLNKPCYKFWSVLKGVYFWLIKCSFSHFFVFSVLRNRKGLKPCFPILFISDLRVKQLFQIYLNWNGKMFSCYLCVFKWMSRGYILQICFIKTLNIERHGRPLFDPICVCACACVCVCSRASVCDCVKRKKDNNGDAYYVQTSLNILCSN